MMEMTAAMETAIIESLDTQTYRCDKLLESEEVKDIKNACAILREWTTESGNVLPTMYLNEELEDCKDEQLVMQFIDKKQVAYGGWFFTADVPDV